MGREDTFARDTIHDLCYAYCMDEKTLFKRADMLLNSYRRICFATYLDDEEEETLFEKSPLDLILFLEEVDPSMNSKDFVRAVRERANRKWIIEMVDSALTKVQETPLYGAQYFDLLNKRYIIQVNYTEPDLLVALHLERSRYYDKRWEAVVMFGLCFWGSVIPRMKKTLSEE